MQNQFAENWNIYVEPFPCYTHDVELAKICIADIEEKYPIGCLPTWYILPNETKARTNGWHTTHGIYEEENKIKANNDSEPIIVFSGKRTPIHPAITKYLVPHEYGHAVQQWIEYKMGTEATKDGSFLKNYAKIRGIEYSNAYGAKIWHSATKEIFANDFRIIIGHVDAEYWPHPGFSHPYTCAAIIDYWDNELMKHKFDKQISSPKE